MFGEWTANQLSHVLRSFFSFEKLLQHTLRTSQSFWRSLSQQHDKVIKEIQQFILTVQLT
jgi:hypothetical protein